MKALAYICSYEEDEQEFLSEMKVQKEKILKFAESHDIEILDFYFEKQFSRNDHKPVLLEIISNFYGKMDKLIVESSDIISRNENFRGWVQDELSRTGVELLTLTKGKSATFVKAFNLKNKIKSIPSLPEVVTKVIQIVQNSDASSDKLDDVISKDAAFTAKILKLANSAFYESPKQVCSTREAIDILGFTTIRGLVLSSETFKVFAKQSPDKEIFNYQKLWKHNLLTAIGADFLYKLIFNEFRECLYSAAILHDLGEIMLAQYDAGNYQKAYSETSKSMNFENNLEAEKKYCGVSHTEIAHLVAEDWNLPDEILDVILYHHSPENSEKFNLSCTIVHVADVISDLLLMEIPLSMDYFDMEELENLKISENNIFLVYNKLASEFKKFDGIDNIFKDK